nr:FecR domain-containing protein [uncultured Carboxylicivirga sp.]
MSENRGNIDELIVKQFTAILTSEEDNQLKNWLEASLDNEDYYKQMRKIWNVSENIGAFNEVDVEGDYNLFAKKVGFNKEIKLGRKTIFTLRNIAAVLLPLITISIGVTLYETTPGFGKWVAYSSNGEVETIVLPDHSEVDLNTHSKLVYEKSLDGNQRKLKLKGEGYFKVTKDPKHPFVVKVGKTEVTVLGTEFYLEEEGVNGATNLIVTDGRVKFASGNKNIIVSKGESAIFKDGDFVRVDTPLNGMSWRTGVIEFEKSDLDQVILALKDHFADEIEKIDNQSKETDRVITTKFDSPTLDEVLVELRIHFDKNFTLDGKKLIISD